MAHTSLGMTEKSEIKDLTHYLYSKKEMSQDRFLTKALGMPNSCNLSHRPVD
jgi:hypothetical protein